VSAPADEGPLAGRLRDGRTDLTVERRAGEVSWRDFTTHSTENVGTTEAHALGIELKPCKP
jgi:hypothetical protein